MDRPLKSRMVAGLILVLLGAWFLAIQFNPALKTWMDFSFSWPISVIGVGAVLFFIGLVAGSPEMSIPACVIAGIGGLLYWQNLSGNWQSWAYCWTLIPGFVGIGSIFTGVQRGDPGQALRHGLRLIVISLILFLIFATFLGGFTLLKPYWPVLLIVFGLLLVFQVIFSK